MLIISSLIFKAEQSEATYSSGNLAVNAYQIIDNQFVLKMVIFVPAAEQKPTCFSAKKLKPGWSHYPFVIN